LANAFTGMGMTADGAEAGVGWRRWVRKPSPREGGVSYMKTKGANREIGLPG